MKKLRATFLDISSWKNRRVFRYIVSGDQEALAKFQMTEHYIYDNPHNTNDPLNGSLMWFSTKREADEVQLIIHNDQVKVA